jgi:predicted RNase H-like HicB family nuclease
MRFVPSLMSPVRGPSVEEARRNLTEAVGLFLEAADPQEIARRLHGEL